MQFYKKIIIATLFFIQFVYAAPEDIVKAAQEGLQKFLKEIPENMWTDYGFSNKEEIKSCTLGTSFAVQIVVPSALKNYQAQDSVASFVENSKMWYFSVMYSGKNRAILVVADIGEEQTKWQAVSFGYVPLALELQQVEKTWGQQRGFKPQIIIAYQARKYFFHIPELNADNLTMIQINTAQATDYFQVDSINNIASSLWEDTRNNMREESYKEIEEEGVRQNASRQVLNLPQVYQKYNQWCWAGCSQSIFNFYGKNVQQEQIAQEGTRGLNIWNWLWGVTSNPYRKGIRELLGNWGLRSSGLNSRLSYNDLQTEISGRRPVVVRWGWDNGGGHFVVCKGLSGNTAYIMDPWSGPTINSYNWLCRGNGHTWTSTLKVNR